MHRLIVGDVAAADGLVMKDAVLVADDGDGASEVAGVDELLHRRLDGGELVGVGPARREGGDQKQ